MTIHDLFGMEVAERGPHIPAYAYRWTNPAFFEKAYKFAVVRNPWDRVVSAYHFMKTSPWPDDRVWSERRLKGIETFDEFLEALRRPLFRHLVLSELHFHPQVDFVADQQDLPLVDRVIYFEHLGAGLRQVAQRLQLALPEGEVDRSNTSSRGDYRGYYDNRGRELVGRMYARDIETFGYDFEGAPRYPGMG